MSGTRMAAAALLACAAAFAQTNANLDRVMAAAKTYFRDIREFPMDVTVTTVVTDAKGKARTQSEGLAGFVFRGFNPRTGTGRFNMEAPMLKRRLLWEGAVGHFTMFHSGAVLRKPADGSVEVAAPFAEVPAVGGADRRKDCAAFELWPDRLYPKNFCGADEYRLSETDGGELIFDHFELKSAGLPAGSKVRYLGDAQVTAFTAEEDFQQALLPGDAKPFLLPKQIVTTVETNKGKVVLTNVYAPKKKR